MNIPVEEMLVVARAQWQVPDESTRTVGIPDDTRIRVGKPAAVLIGR
jgi:hypothetical protein